VWSYGLESVQVTSGTADLTRWNVLFWPRCGSDTTIHYRYRRQIDILTSSSDGVTDATDYPIGGEEFSTAIREACMMMVEEDRGVMGPAHKTYDRVLAEAISRDSKNKPRNRGYNGDNSDNRRYPRRRELGTVTFNA
jgi:hypothetical protein